MSENINFIRFFSWATCIFLILTYVFSLVSFSWEWLNSNFLVVAFGGLFASFGVMLLAEIKKYHVNKHAVEDKLYYTLLSLYNELTVESKNADAYLNNPNTAVPENLFSFRAPAINAILYSLKCTDYSPIKRNVIFDKWSSYRENEFPVMDNHVNACNTRLTIAIIDERLNALDRQIMSYHPSASDKYVGITLRKMKADADERLKAIETMLAAISSLDNKRYNWQKEKDLIQSIKIGLPSENQELNKFFTE